MIIQPGIEWLVYVTISSQNVPIETVLREGYADRMPQYLLLPTVRPLAQLLGILRPSLVPES